MIRKPLIELIFEAASIERWNDHIRPSRGFTELDKQAHKMICAYVLGNLESDIDQLKLIEGGIFEFLHRLLLTDIKPPIFHKLMKEKGRELNKWTINQITPEISSIKGGFSDRFAEYFLNPDYAKKEKEVLEASHYLATKWEFDIIYDMCSKYYGIDKTRREIDSKLESLEKYQFFKKFQNDKNYQGFINLLGELRFQQRWARCSRIPATSVIGHMIIVAILSYLCSCEIECCPKRSANDFWGGLFHDVPEVLTRDIVSPVKASVSGLDELIKNIEREQMESVLYPLIPKQWRKDMDYYTSDEFSDKINVNGNIVVTDFLNSENDYNKDEFNPIDGKIIRACDHLSACIETYVSHTSGVTTRTLVNANQELYNKYKNYSIGSIDFGMLFDYFRI